MSAADLRRVSVIGNSGSGKSTPASRLARRLDLPLVELDALWHDAGWINPTRDEFRTRVRLATQGDRWVVDGKYASVREAIWERATTVVWIDLPR